MRNRGTAPNGAAHGVDKLTLCQRSEPPPRRSGSFILRMWTGRAADRRAPRAPKNRPFSPPSEPLSALYQSEIHVVYVDSVGRDVCIPGRLA